VVNALLSSKDHELSVLLVRQLLACQAAATLEAKLEQHMAVENRSESKSTRLSKLEFNLDAARQSVIDLQLQLETTRVSLRELRR